MLLENRMQTLNIEGYPLLVEVRQRWKLREELNRVNQPAANELHVALIPCLIHVGFHDTKLMTTFEKGKLKVFGVSGL